MKKIGLISVLLIGGLTLSGCSNKEELVVSTWAFGVDQMEETWVKPFEEEYGVDVVLDTGGTGERYSKLESNPNSDVDVFITSQDYDYKGQKAGLWQDFDDSKLTNYDDLYDSAKNPNGEKTGPAYTYNRLAIVYNPELVEGDVSSFKEILEREDITSIAIPDIIDTQGPSFLQLMANTLGVDLYSKEGSDKVFKEIEKLSDKVVKNYISSTDVITMMETKEAQVALVPEYYYKSIQEVVPDAKWVDPKEGAVMNFNTMEITKNTDNPELAYKFIDFMISQDIQTNVANAQMDAPVNKEADVDSFIEGIPFTNLDEFETIDYSKMSENMDAFTKRWYEIFNSGGADE